MRVLPLVLVVVVAPGLLLAGGQATAPVTPEQAAKMVGKTVTVEMVVKSAKRGGGGDVWFLNSRADHKDPKNFVLFVTRAAVEKFEAAKVERPHRHFEGKTVRATGKVGLFRDRPEMRIEDPAQIKLVTGKE
jgi:DNA/RNA endonuclease YhcR with UshA esterase domain